MRCAVKEGDGLGGCAAGSGGDGRRELDCLTRCDGGGSAHERLLDGGLERRTGGRRLCATRPQCQEKVKVTVTCTIWPALTGMGVGEADVNSGPPLISPVGRLVRVLEVRPRH